LVEDDACYKHLAPDGAKSGAAWHPTVLSERHSLSADRAAEPQPTLVLQTGQISVILSTHIVATRIATGKRSNLEIA